jgi:hypothetical protein
MTARYRGTAYGDDPRDFPDQQIPQQQNPWRPQSRHGVGYSPDGPGVRAQEHANTAPPGWSGFPNPEQGPGIQQHQGGPPPPGWTDAHVAHDARVAHQQGLPMQSNGNQHGGNQQGTMLPAHAPQQPFQAGFTPPGVSNNEGRGGSKGHSHHDPRNQGPYHRPPQERHTM